MVITFDHSTTVVISRDPGEPECEVCVDGSTTNCSPTDITVMNTAKLSLEFSCLRPQDMYSVKIRKEIGENCVLFKLTAKFGEEKPIYKIVMNVEDYRSTEINT